MAAYLITHSLLSSWLHLIRENPYEDLTTEGDPLAEFMLVLKREPTPRTEAIRSNKKRTATFEIKMRIQQPAETNSSIL